MTCRDRTVEGGGQARHALLAYDCDDSLRAGAVPYLRAGLVGGETVIAVVSAEVQQVLGAALGEDAARVHWQAGEVSYARLGVMFEGFRSFFAEQRAAVAPEIRERSFLVGEAERSIDRGPSARDRSPTVGRVTVRARSLSWRAKVICRAARTVLRTMLSGSS